MGGAKLGKICTDEFSCGSGHHFPFLTSHPEGGEYLHWSFPGHQLSPGERLGQRRAGARGQGSVQRVLSPFEEALHKAWSKKGCAALALAACLQPGAFCRGYPGRFISHPVAIFLPGPRGHSRLDFSDHLALSTHPVQVLEGDMSPLL